MKNLQLNKLLASTVAAVAMVAAMVPAANAAVGTANFNVTATLTSACTVGVIGDLAFGAVTAFVAPANATTTALISCTRTLAGVTAVFDTAAGTKGSSAAATTPTGDGVLSNGLSYTLSTAKGAVTAGTAADNTSIGTADTFTYTITGAMAAQAGTCAVASCAGTQLRTMTLNF